VVICEEAGEVLESHMLASLTSGTDQMILIGDHKQLRPKVAEYRLSVDSGRGYNLDVSLFEKLILRAGTQSNALITLSTQRRMKPIISNLLRSTLYPSLVDAPNVAEYPSVRGFNSDLWFFTHEHPESRESKNTLGATVKRSYFNQFESEMVVELVKYVVLACGYQTHQIAVLTPYAAQLMLIRQLLSKAEFGVKLSENDIVALEASGIEFEIAASSSSLTGGDRHVRLATVDNFQGEEADVVIISTVRNNEGCRTGFLKIENRVNVMISRAKHGMFLLGSERTIRVTIATTSCYEYIPNKRNTFFFLLFRDATKRCCFVKCLIF